MVRLLVSKVSARSSARCLPLPCNSKMMAKRRSVLFMQGLCLFSCPRTRDVKTPLAAIIAQTIHAAPVPFLRPLQIRWMDGWRQGFLLAGLIPGPGLAVCRKRSKQVSAPLLIEDLDDVRPHLLQAETKAFQHPCSYAFALPEQAQAEAFGAQVVMMEAPRFVDGKLQHFLSPWGQTDFARREMLSATHDTLDGLTSPLEIDAQACKHFTGHAFPLAEQAPQEMFSPGVVLLYALRRFLRETHPLPRSLREPVEAPSLVHACFGSLSTGTGPAVTSQPSADRAKKFLSYHLLILSVCLLTSI